MMNSKIFQVKKYLEYWFKASNSKGHGMHSPFVYNFIRDILLDKTNYEAYQQVEDLRSRLLKNDKTITVADFGAGSTKTSSNKRAIAAIAKNAAKPKKYAQLLYRIVKHYRPEVVIELGTSLGISAAYLALANKQARVVTMEGAPEIAACARGNFESLSINNIEIVVGDFQKTLQPTLNKMSTIDFVFIDGNHRKEPTIQYFNSLLPLINQDTLLIFDDIYWSSEMAAAWATIKQHPQVTCTIDLFYIGLVFFRTEHLTKMDYVVKF